MNKNDIPSLNPNFEFDENGNVTTKDDAWLNRILQETQSENGPLGAVIPAVTFELEPDDSEKIYIGLMKTYDDKDYWLIITGRQRFYDTMISLVRAEEIDPNESFVIPGNLIKEPMSDKENMLIQEVKPITVFRFLKSMRDSKKVIDDETFDIDEYDSGYTEGDNTILDVN